MTRMLQSAVLGSILAVPIAAIFLLTLIGAQRETDAQRKEAETAQRGFEAALKAAEGERDALLDLFPLSLPQSADVTQFDPGQWLVERCENFKDGNCDFAVAEPPTLSGCPSQCAVTYRAFELEVSKTQKGWFGETFVSESNVSCGDEGRVPASFNVAIWPTSINISERSEISVGDYAVLVSLRTDPVGSCGSSSLILSGVAR